jgi:signal transduction histidine kinase
MTAIASPEFISLCQAQLRLLTQRLSESSAALYIADVLESGNEQSNFIPVVSYPEPVESWVANFERATPWSRNEAKTRSSSQLALPGSVELPNAASVIAPEPHEPAFRWPDILRPEQQLVMPLVYTDVVVGLLVAVRPDRDWGSEERRYLEVVAQSLAGGCVLERRNQWLQSQLAHKNGLQNRQSEIFHNLLHQFRNPLTAVSTFGQLLVKRLEPEDPNQPIATGIVRENKRLRELVTHFDEAVALGDTDLNAEGAQLTSQLSAAQPLLLAESRLAESRLAESELTESEPAGSGSAESPAIGLGHPLTLSAQYLPDIVGPTLAVAGIVAAEKGVTLHAQVASDTPCVWGEEEALGEVVSNLVDNAIKYSPAGAEVWVQTGVSRVGAVGAHYQNHYQNHYQGHYQGIVVGDTGPGIPASDLARLFERHYRGVQAEGVIPGTGLGLAIAQSLVSEMQGSIEVISPAVGTPWMPKLASTSGAGTVFIVWLLEVERS